MAELIEALNNTNGIRVFFYLVCFIIITAIIVDGIAHIIKYLKN